MDYFTPASLRGDPEASHRAHLVAGLAMLGGLFGTSYTLFYLLIGHAWGAAVIVVCTLLMVSVPFVMRATGRVRLAGNLHALIWTIGFSALTALEGGTYGHAVAWLAAGVPLLALLILDTEIALVWCGICFLATLFFCVLGLFHVDLPLAYPERWHPAVTAAGYVGFALFLTLLGLIFEFSRKDAFRRMEAALCDLSKSNERLRTSEHFIQRIADATPGLLYMIDLASQTIVYANERLIRALGFPPKDKTKILLSDLERNLSEPVIERALATVRERLFAAEEGAVIETEYHFNEGGVESHWVCYHTVFSRAPTGEPLCILGMAENVTERRRAEEALRQAENRFAAFMRNLPGVAFMKDREGRFVYASDHVDTVTGLSATAVLGMKMNDFWPEHAARLNALDEEILRTGRPIQTVETLPMADRLHYWLMHKFPIRDNTGTPAMIGGMAIDITDRIIAEQKLEAALQKEEVLKREVHHRVKNNLQVIISLLYLQSEQVSDPVTLEVLRESQSRTRSIALIHELLCRSENLSRIEFSEYVRLLTADLLTGYRISRRQITLTIAGRGIFLSLDTAIPCGLIINELVSNALKHAFPDGRAGEITIALQPTGTGALKLNLRDNGVGLSSGFDLENAQTMGLKLVRDLTRQLGGTVEFRSDHGAVVNITFPNPDSASGAQEA